MIERSLVRYRIRLIRERTRISNYLQGILSLHGVNISTSQLTRHYDSNVTYLKVLDVHHLFIINELIEIIRFFDTRIEMISEKLNTLLPANDPRMQLIMSIPGFGIELSRIVVVELRDISEFPNRVSLRSYAGLAPFVSESADKKKKSRLNKHSNRYLRYALIMAAHHARWHPKFSSKYRRDIKKHNKVIAKVNLARRLCNILYWVMTRQQPYQG
jgi:transposase